MSSVACCGCACARLCLVFHVCSSLACLSCTPGTLIAASCCRNCLIWTVSRNSKMRSNKHVSLPLQPRPVAHNPRPQLLTIMSSSIDYLTSRTNFLQVSQEIPKPSRGMQRNTTSRTCLQVRRVHSPVFCGLTGRHVRSEPEGTSDGPHREGKAGGVPHSVLT